MQNLIEKPTSKLKESMRKTKEAVEEQCQDIEETPQKNNSKKTYQLVKELTSSKQGRTTVQDKAGKCLSEEQDILKRWTEYCSKLYTHNNNRRSQGARWSLRQTTKRVTLSCGKKLKLQ